MPAPSGKAVQDVLAEAQKNIGSAVRILGAADYLSLLDVEHVKHNNEHTIIIRCPQSHRVFLPFQKDQAENAVDAAFSAIARAMRTALKIALLEERAKLEKLAEEYLSGEVERDNETSGE